MNPLYRALLLVIAEDWPGSSVPAELARNAGASADEVDAVREAFGDRSLARLLES